MSEIKTDASPIEAIDELDVWTFGEIESPVTNVIDVPLGDDWQCPCGHVLNLGGNWLAAHWTDKLQRTCDKCGQLFLIRAGRIRLSKKVGRWG